MRRKHPWITVACLLPFVVTLSELQFIQASMSFPFPHYACLGLHFQPLWCLLWSLDFLCSTFLPWFLLHPSIHRWYLKYEQINFWSCWIWLPGIKTISARKNLNTIDSKQSLIEKAFMEATGIGRFFSYHLISHRLPLVLYSFWLLLYQSNLWSNPLYLCH